MVSPGNRRRNRNFAGGHFFLASALALLGQFDEARAVVQAGRALDPTFTINCRSASNFDPTPVQLEIFGTA